MFPIRGLLQKLRAEEERFNGSVFLAPQVSGRLAIRIAGIVKHLIADDAPKGWGIFQADGSHAIYQGEATREQIHEYLEQLQSVRFITLGSKDFYLLGTTAQKLVMDSAIQVPVYFPGDDPVELFDTVVARFDGAMLFYERVDYRRDPKVPDYLRHALVKNTEPEKIKFSGLTPEEKYAYELLWEAEQENRVDRETRRVSTALEHAGAKLESYRKVGAAYIVNFQVDGESRVAHIDPNDFTVVSAGICLSGEDRKFDMTSLVSVLREGKRKGRW